MIEKLKKANILVEITDKQRGKVYCARELLSLLEGDRIVEKYENET